MSIRTILLESLFSGTNLVGSEPHFGDEYVQASSAFQCRAMRGVEEPATILG